MACRPRSRRSPTSNVDFARVVSIPQEIPRRSLEDFSAAVGILASTKSKAQLKSGTSQYRKLFLCKKSFYMMAIHHRLVYAGKTRAESRNYSEHLRRVAFFDECIFHPNKVVNKYNIRFCGLKDPHFVQNGLLTSEMVTVWCGLHKTRTTGSFFLMRR